ncbi:toxin co-regulated pilus biosynthesis Q family protein [Klebsiella aerogenes]
MKKRTVILPLLLTACSSHTDPTPGTPPAQQTVDTLIQSELSSLTLTQQELAMVSGVQFESVTAPHRVAPTVHPTTATATPSTVSGMANVTYTGTAPALPALVTRGGKNQSLPVALQAIAPPGWHSVLSQSLGKVPPRFNWAAGDQWPRTLDKLAGQYHLKITIMWASHQVTADWQNYPAQTGKSPFSGASPTAAPPALPVKPTLPPARVWRAETGKTLKDVIFDWAATADCHGQHWQVAWVTPVNYRIDAPLSFTGTWQDALNGIFTLYQTAATPLYAGTATPQCILKVDDKPMR